MSEKTCYPIILNGDHAEFERENENVPPKDRSDWPLPSFDARDWAEAFCKQYPSIDSDVMVAWFANALMRGFDETAPKIATLRARIAELEARAPVVVTNSVVDRACNAWCDWKADQGADPRVHPDWYRMHAALTAALAVGTGDCWPSIETAPKDGTEFLASQDGEVYQCRWSIKDDGQGSRQAGWYDLVGRSFEQPTHWHPLPPAPSKGGE